MRKDLIIIGISSAIVIAVIVTAVVVAEVRKGKINLGPGNGKPKGKECPILPFNSLIKCTSDKDCSKCAGATLGYRCYNVNENNPYKYTDTDGTTYNMPDGQYCLPQKVETEKCNLYTGIPILTKKGENEYAWACQCINNNWFDSPPGGDCTNEVLCGYQSGLGELVCPPGVSACKEGESWLTNKNWDPSIGICKCKAGYAPINTVDSTGRHIKTCSKDPCAPIGHLQSPPVYGGNICGKPRATSTCTGAKFEKNSDGTYKSWIRCPEDIADASVRQACAVYPKYFPDPCNPYGYYDTALCKCICNKKYSRQQPSNNIVGSECDNPCLTENQCGGRGTCYVTDKGLARCKDCVPPWRQNPPLNTCDRGCTSKGYKCGNDDDCCLNLKCKWQFSPGPESLYVCK